MPCMFGHCKEPLVYSVTNERGGAIGQLCYRHWRFTWEATPHPGMHVKNDKGEHVGCCKAATATEPTTLDDEKGEHVGNEVQPKVAPFDSDSRELLGSDTPQEAAGGTGLAPRGHAGSPEGRRHSPAPLVPAPAADAEFGREYQIAEALARSGFFPDIKSVSQALVKMLAGKEIGISPVASMKGIYIIQGTPSYSASIMAAVIQRSGRWSYELKVLSAEVCALDFFEAGQFCGRSEFTLEDARNAGLLVGKNAHSWKHYPRNMLFARAMSNGARWYCAGAFGGLTPYTPEEVGGLLPPIKPGREPDPATENEYCKPEDYKDEAGKHLEAIAKDK